MDQSDELVLKDMENKILNLISEEAEVWDVPAEEIFSCPGINRINTMHSLWFVPKDEQPTACTICLGCYTRKDLYGKTDQDFRVYSGLIDCNCDYETWANEMIANNSNEFNENNLEVSI